MTYCKKLIEVALPLEAINKASAREKSIRHGHPSTLHLWWARRPLAACRAVIFASLVDDPDDPHANPEFVQACKALPKGVNASANDTPRQRLFDFIERLVQWESTTDDDVIGKARELINIATDGNPPPLLDPFAGGGSIPLEAQRLGLEAHASDLNPVAVMINKALIEIPPLFANMPPVNPRDRKGTGEGAHWRGAAGLAADIRYYGEWVQKKAFEKIGYLFPKFNGEVVIAWLWARTVKCPNPVCGAQMPLLTSFWLSKNKENASWLKPKINKERKLVEFEIQSGSGAPKESVKVGRGANFRCLICGQTANEKNIRDQFVKKKDGKQLIAIVTDGENQRNFWVPDDKYQLIDDLVENVWIPPQEMDQNNSNLVSGRGYGVKYWSELFTNRQLITLSTLCTILSEAQNQIFSDAVLSGMFKDDISLHCSGHGAYAYSEGLRIYLAFGISRIANTLCKYSRWTSVRQQTVTAFARQALPMTWDFPEVNPFSGAAGDYLISISSIANAVQKLPAAVRGYSNQIDAVELEFNTPFFLSTDPPYYDNIGYADLSDFSYIWLRKSLGNVFPNIFSTLLVPKEKEIVAMSHRFDGDINAAKDHFELGLKKTFVNMREQIKPKFPITVYYAFKQEELIVNEGASSTGWEVMLNSLIDSGFVIVGTWPIRTELSNRLIASDANVLASSIVLVCLPRFHKATIISRRDFIKKLNNEIPLALHEMQSGNIAPVDFAQASIGPGMSVFSRYNKVLEPNGEPMTVRTALQLINHELDSFLSEQEGYIDTDSRFAIAWFEQFGFKEGPFGQADVLARAKNTSVDGLVSAGVLESGAGRVRLLHWSELDPGWDPSTDRRLTAWEAVHHLIARLDAHGEEGAALLLAKMPSDLAAESRQLAYRLYSICDRKSWAKHARDYNALVISWGASQEQARELRDRYQQSELFK